MEKVIIGLKGGLGNQMFQYALGELLRRKHGRDVYYDKGFFNGPFSERVTPRKYELDAFGIKLAKEVDFKFYKSTKPLKRLGRKLMGIPAFDIFVIFPAVSKRRYWAAPPTSLPRTPDMPTLSKVG